MELLEDYARMSGMSPEAVEVTAGALKVRARARLTESGEETGSVGGTRSTVVGWDARDGSLSWCPQLLNSPVPSFARENGPELSNEASS